MREPLRWLYHFPHDNEGTFCWADVYLLPDREDWNGGSLWLTVDALGGPDGDPKRRAYLEAQMGPADHHLERDSLDLSVREELLTQERLLHWVRVAIGALGLRCTELVPAPFERFLGTNNHAIALERSLELVRELEKEQGDSAPEA